jgi:NitT/TauT family transport system substrate-binding protein
MTFAFSRTRKLGLTAIVGATLLALVGCSSADGDPADSPGSNDGAPEIANIKIGVFPSFNALGAHAAEYIGAFEDEGLTVEFVTVGTPADVIPQLGTQLQFGLSDMTVPIQATDKGMPLQFVAPGSMGTPLNDDNWGSANLWVSENSEFKTVADLENATFGIVQLNSQLWIDVRAAVDDAGGDSSKMTFVETPGATAIPALANGDIDATTTAEPSGTRAKATPGIKHLEGFVTAGGDVGFGFIAQKSFVDANPNTAAAFQRAILKGNVWANANPEEVVDVAVGYVDAPRELLAASIYPLLSEEPVSAKSVANAIERMSRYGVLTGDGPDPKSMVFNAN